MTESQEDAAKAELYLPEGLQSQHLGISSDLWSHCRASDIFIKPTVTSGEGIVHLKGIVLDVVSCAVAVIETIAGYDLELKHDCSYLLLALNLMNEHEFGDGAATDKAVGYFDNYIVLMRERRGLLALSHERVLEICSRFELVGRLCEQIETLQKLHGDKLLREPELIAKLMIAMKCLDTSWQAAITSHKENWRDDEGLYEEFGMQIPNFCNILINGEKKTLIRRGENGPEFLEGWMDDTDDEIEADTESESEEEKEKQANIDQLPEKTHTAITAENVNGNGVGDEKERTQAEA